MAPKFSFRSLCPVTSAARVASPAPGGRSPELAAGLRRAAWLKTLLKLHWISSAICLLGIVLFSVTGITLNHAGQIEANPVTVQQKRSLPANHLEILQQLSRAPSAQPRVLTVDIARWLALNFKVDVTDAGSEWADDEIYFPLPRPGGDAWLRISLADGEVEHEVTDRGWISWLNDLHKGRHTGGAWSLFIDVFAAGCLIFSLSGLLILKMHAVQRLSTWPLVGLGVLIPALLALLFIH